MTQEKRNKQKASQMKSEIKFINCVSTINRGGRQIESNGATTMISNIRRNKSGWVPVLPLLPELINKLGCNMVL